MGNVCTGGTGCTTNPAADRSLLDMIDLSFDEAGRVGVIFTDNYSSFQDIPGAEDDPPFVEFAKQVSGPSVLASVGALNVSVPTGGRTDRSGDATWPNVTGAANLRALDLASTSIALENGQVVARIHLADATAAGMIRDLAAYNAANGTCVPITSCQADRLQYVARFATSTEVYHLSMDVTAAGVTRFFGGMLGANDKLVSEISPTTTFGAAYKADAGFPVSGSIVGDTIVLRAPASAFGLRAGDLVVNAAGYALAGPSEATEISVGRIMRTVDRHPAVRGDARRGRPVRPADGRPRPGQVGLEPDLHDRGHQRGPERSRWRHRRRQPAGDRHVQERDIVARQLCPYRADRSMHAGQPGFRRRRHRDDRGQARGQGDAHQHGVGLLDRPAGQPAPRTTLRPRPQWWGLERPRSRVRPARSDRPLHGGCRDAASSSGLLGRVFRRARRRGRRSGERLGAPAFDIPPGPALPACAKAGPAVEPPVGFPVTFPFPPGSVVVEGDVPPGGGSRIRFLAPIEVPELRVNSSRRSCPRPGCRSAAGRPRPTSSSPSSVGKVSTARSSPARSAAARAS